jgi:hypothetical protein
MAKFMLIKISLMAEITDAGARRAKPPSRNSTPPISRRMTTPRPLTGTHRRKASRIATEDKTALHALVDVTKARKLLDGVPGAKAAGMSSMVVEVEGTTQREARDAWGKREGIPWLSDLPEPAD